MRSVGRWLRRCWHVLQRALGRRQEGPPASFQLVGGRASNPTEIWRPNDPSVPERSLEEALQIARDGGVEFDAAEFLFVVARSAMPPGTYASYFAASVPAGSNLVFELARLKTTDGRFRVTLCPKILTSDETILAVVAHEVHEIRALEGAFLANGMRLPAPMLHSLINTKTGTLHCAAWAHADEMVRRRRGT